MEAMVWSEAPQCPRLPSEITASHLLGCGHRSDNYGYIYVYDDPANLSTMLIRFNALAAAHSTDQSMGCPAKHDYPPLQ